MLHSDLVKLVCGYVPYYVLLDWVDPKKLKPSFLSLNLRAIDYLMENPHLIRYPQVYANKGTDIFVQRDLHKLVLKKHIWEKSDEWYYISFNWAAIDIIENNLDKCDDEKLNINKYAVNILEKHPYLIDFREICRNENAIHIIKNMLKYKLNKISWEYLSANANAIDIIEEELKKPDNKINFEWLSMNRNACHIIMKNQDKISWRDVSVNSGFIDLLKANQDKIDWMYFSGNINIFRPTFNQTLYNVMIKLL